MDRLLIPANRESVPLDRQLQQLLEKFDLTCGMKSSPSRSKRLKLLKKTINDVRNEMSLKRVLSSLHSAFSSTSSTLAPSLPFASHPEPGEPTDERLKPNGHFTDDEGMNEKRINSIKEQLQLGLIYSKCQTRITTTHVNDVMAVSLESLLTSSYSRQTSVQMASVSLCVFLIAPSLHKWKMKHLIMCSVSISYAILYYGGCILKPKLSSIVKHKNE